MQTALLGQANILTLPIVAKASGGPIKSGTVNFYLVDLDGAHAGKWYRGSDTSWQSSESIAGAATHRADGHWYLSLPTAVWELGTRYHLYAQESGDLHIPFGEDVLCEIARVSAIEFVSALMVDTGITEGGVWTVEKLLKVLAAWAAGNWRLKTGTSYTYELLDAEDASTVILEQTLSNTTPYKTVTIKI